MSINDKKYYDHSRRWSLSGSINDQCKNLYSSGDSIDNDSLMV